MTSNRSYRLAVVLSIAALAVLSGCKTSEPKADNPFSASAETRALCADKIRNGFCGAGKCAAGKCGASLKDTCAKIFDGQ